MLCTSGAEWLEMIVIADTNILARIITKDNAQQFEAASRIFLSAEKVIVPAIVFCELSWLLRSSYQCDRKFIATAIREIISNAKNNHRRERCACRIANTG